MKKSFLAALALASAGFAAVAANTPPPAPPAANSPAPAAPAAATSMTGMNTDFFFVINCTPPTASQAGNNLHFEIVVNSRTNKFSPDAEGLLEIFDPKARIFSGDLQPLTDGKILKYSFDLSPQYLGKSRFSFKCTFVDEKGNQNSEVIWAHLQDFMKPGLR